MLVEVDRQCLGQLGGEECRELSVCIWAMSGGVRGGQSDESEMPVRNGARRGRTTGASTVWPFPDVVEWLRCVGGMRVGRLRRCRYRCLMAEVEVRMRNGFGAGWVGGCESRAAALFAACQMTGRRKEC
jgi:hypothetical protein